MASVPTPAAAPTPVPAPAALGRPLQREGAQYFLSAAEQAIEDAMMRLSPPPEQVLGKRVHDDDQPEASDGELDEESSTNRPQPLSPSISNLTVATLRYAAKKKLRPEQRDDIEAFFLASALLTLRMILSDPSSTG